jgi:hypothetical protein
MDPRGGAVMVALTGFVACGGGSGSPAKPTGGGTDSRTFAGTTTATGPSSCAGDRHDFQAAEGPVTVTLIESTGNAMLVAQVCAGGIDNGNCTINQTTIGVGQSLSSPRKGGPSQTLALQPLNCGGGGPPPAGPIAYTASVTYQR